MKEKIDAIVKEILQISNYNIENVNRESNSNWDSLKHLEIMMALEEEFEIRLSVAEVTNINSVSDLYTCIARKVN